jgi:hypothetical protein
MVNSNAESRAGRLGGEQDGADQRPRNSNSQKQFRGTSKVGRGRTGRTAGADRTGSCSSSDAAGSAKAIAGGIVSQLIGSLVNQRALFEGQIEAINEQIQGLQQLQEELNRQFEDDP